MRKEIADIVFPVFGKQLKSKKGAHEERAWDFADAQKKLLALLQAPFPISFAPISSAISAIDASISTTRLGFLGIRYAMACWLDEIFIGDSPWKDHGTAAKSRRICTALTTASEFWKQRRNA